MEYCKYLLIGKLSEVEEEIYKAKHEIAMAKFGGPHYKDLRKRMARLLRQRDSLKRKLEGKE